MKIREALIKVFGKGGPLTVGAAPGRVNLIGEHTDYHGGFVFPMAIEFGIELAGRVRNDRQVRLYAADFDQTAHFSLDAPLVPDQVQAWSNYGRGVLWALEQAGVERRGVDLAFSGNLPMGAGLSSSAALEVATAVVLQDLLGFSMDPVRLALICQQAENEFVGLKCGIMDPFVSMMGKRAHALFIDCRSLKFKPIPLELTDHVMAICHSGVKHSLVTSEYNQRRQECDAGVQVLKTRWGAVQALRDVNLAQLEACRGEMTDVVYRRCRHVISENQRVLESAEALQRSDLCRFGQLMDASHDSLRDDYQVSCSEVDLLVELARQLPGVLGARITGGGFGGCTVNLVSKTAIGEFEQAVMGKYQRQTGLTPRVFLSVPADGARILHREK